MSFATQSFNPLEVSTGPFDSAFLNPLSQRAVPLNASPAFPGYMANTNYMQAFATPTSNNKIQPRPSSAPSSSASAGQGKALKSALKKPGQPRAAKKVTWDRTTAYDMITGDRIPKRVLELGLAHEWTSLNSIGYDYGARKPSQQDFAQYGGDSCSEEQLESTWGTEGYFQGF